MLKLPFTKSETPRDDADPAYATDDRLAAAPPSGYQRHVIEVTDPLTNETFTISGEIVTKLGGPHELPGDLRQHIVASEHGEIYYSRNQANNPAVMSAVKRLLYEFPPSVRARAQAIDPTSISEFYRQDSAASSGRAARKVSDSSRMQREFVAIVAQAASQSASDIHIIVNQDRAAVRYRIGGDIKPISEMPPQYAFELLSAAFALADTSDASYQMTAYQAARISSLSTDLPPGVQSLRLQFNPLANDGRYLIARILYSGEGEDIRLESLGYNAKQIDMLETLSARPVGINIISGPTGSGKSTTLKALLERVIDARDGEVNTITIEDPPEYVIRKAQQMPVTNAKTQEGRNEAFTAAISAGLRSDPDIMMIGEIRDPASANLAVEGALSGHPIYASLHANTAMDILVRLRDMGVEGYKVFDPGVFAGLVGQRLVKSLCPHCKIPLRSEQGRASIGRLLMQRIEHMLEATPEHLRDREIYVAGPGCPECSGGYAGRSVVAEIILPDDHFMSLMSQGKKTDARTYWFRELGGIDLLGAAWLRVLDGTLSPVTVENSVALLSPIAEHTAALEKWHVEA